MTVGTTRPAARPSMTALTPASAPGSRLPQSIQAPSSRCWEHHHSAVAGSADSTHPVIMPPPNPLRNGAWIMRAPSQTRSQISQRQTAARTDAWGRRQHHSQTA
ncbi:hypothetical protein ACF08O_07930 [Streptomyces paradoxus]|uniref:hypothetical protein n=1 Tax=Streptomyces paradoxus TaxID=66375 RepID=UPI0036F99044